MHLPSSSSSTPSTHRSRHMSKGKEKCSERREGRKVLRRRGCSQYSGHDGRCQSSSSSQAPTATVKVKGLPKETTELTQQFIQHILAQWRPFLQIRVMMKTNTNICRGMAFIDFPSIVAAKKMMDMVADHGLDVNGRKLSFQYRSREVSELAGDDLIANSGTLEQVIEEEENDQGDDEEDEDDSDYVDEVARKRLPVEWTLAEVRMLKEAYHYLVKDDKKRSWKDMLKYGHNVFHYDRTSEDLRSKWKHLVRTSKWDCIEFGREGRP